MVTAIKRLLEYETLWPHQNYFYLLFDQGNPTKDDNIVREKDLYYKKQKKSPQPIYSD